MPTPLYTPENCRPAFQLRWSLALFGNSELPSTADWLASLKSVTEGDGVRILEAQNRSNCVCQFLVSTTPNVAPPAIVKSIKGRLQHLWRATHPNVFRRNFDLSSVGDVSRAAAEDYVADQLGHHQMADEWVQASLARFQLSFPSVDLSIARFSSHGRYLYNLHIVLVHNERWREFREDQFTITRDMIVRIASKKEHLLSRAAVLSDHIHLVVGCPTDCSPSDIALGYLNNLAFAHDMQPRYSFGYYVGTCGQYDMGTVWQSLASSHGSTDAGSVGAGKLCRDS